MNNSPFFALLAIITLMWANPIFAQVWMSNYSYRKLITIDKNKVSPSVTTEGTTYNYHDLVDFPVLIELQDRDFIHNPGACGNKIDNIEGRDISFALSSAPSVPLNFQLESYIPASGKLRCWVKIPALSARMTASTATSLYIYYGSSALHDPEGSSAQQTWSNDYIGIWHMNLDGIPPWTKNSKNLLAAQRAVASTGIGAGNYQNCPLGTGVSLNGLSESLKLDIGTTNSFTISAWIKVQTIGSEQVIVTNDSAYSNGLLNGFVMKINASGNLIVELHRSSLGIYSQSSQTPLQPNIWYYLCMTTTGMDLFLAINAERMQGRSGTSLRLGQGGTVNLGVSKQGNAFFRGMIDEFRIQQGVKGIEWFQTEYANQKDPATFYVIFQEEFNPGQYKRFTGKVNSLWNLPANWSTEAVPINNENIVVSTGKTLRIQGIANLSINKLLLEKAATLSLGNDLDLKCKTEIATNANIKLDDGMKLTFEADIRNDGQIGGKENKGKLIFSSTNVLQRVYGNGSLETYILENAQHSFNQQLIFESPVLITGNLKLTKGTLNANNMLVLTSSEQIGSAALSPISNLNDVDIIGNVQVQTYIPGNFPTPSTARGWRLFSSPVYQKNNEDSHQYNISAFKSSMFITGPGGATNGFDPSPLNGGTVYIHDQSLPGSLSQKYQTIPLASSEIPLGKGIFVFSRGSRHAPNAYVNQLQTPPFSNPSGYTITHVGQLYKGDLSIALSNRNTGQEGDGFNLLGNPYASGITWGRLSRSNLSEFIWLFDPINNAYVVSDDPEMIIPSGSGFFVRVIAGKSDGLITFTENSKYEILSGSSGLGNISHHNSESLMTIRDALPQRITVTLSKGSFKQDFILKLRNNGNDAIDDQDALKIGEGYVSIAGICEGTKLAIEEKAWTSAGNETRLRVNGWEAGKYMLTVSGIKDMDNIIIQLRDNYINYTKSITNGFSYEFDMVPGAEATQETERFIISFRPAPNTTLVDSSRIKVYPNPFKDCLYITSSANIEKYRIIIRNIEGKIIKAINVTADEDILFNQEKKLQKGLYLIQVFDEKTNKLIKAFKVLRQ